MKTLAIKAVIGLTIGLLVWWSVKAQVVPLTPEDARAALLEMSSRDGDLGLEMSLREQNIDWGAVPIVWTSETTFLVAQVQVDLKNRTWTTPENHYPWWEGEFSQTLFGHWYVSRCSRFQQLCHAWDPSLTRD